MVYACLANQVAAKLQAVLRANPKKARPSCRKERKEAAAKATKKEIRIKKEPMPASAAPCLAPDREVWEVSDDSDVEVLVVERLRPVASSELVVPEVASMHAGKGMFHIYFYACVCMVTKASCDEERSWKILQASWHLTGGLRCKSAWTDNIMNCRLPGAIDTTCSSRPSTRRKVMTLVCIFIAC